MTKITESELERLLGVRKINKSDLELINNMANALLSTVPNRQLPLTDRAMVIKGDRFATEHGQVVICDDIVYALLADNKWHLWHSLGAHDRATLQLIERGFIIEPNQLAHLSR